MCDWTLRIVETVHYKKESSVYVRTTFPPNVICANVNVDRPVKPACQIHLSSRCRTLCAIPSHLYVENATESKSNRTTLYCDTIAYYVIMQQNMIYYSLTSK